MADSVEVVAERLLQVIDEARRTATYKLALLVALMDACAAQADADGHAPLEMHTRVLAHHVLRIYLPQARAYLAGEGGLQRFEERLPSRISSCGWLGAQVRGSGGRTRVCRWESTVGKRSAPHSRSHPIVFRPCPRRHSVVGSGR